MRRSRHPGSARAFDYGVQLDAIMRTVSTFSFGALLAAAVEPVAVDPAVEPVAGPLDLSSVPVISTLCPT
jgi:hypothetical protein